MRRLVFCLLALVSSFCTVSRADENWLRLRTLFGEGGLPSEASLKLHQKWSCTDGIFYIFDATKKGITAYTSSGQIDFLITPKSLKQVIQRKESITSFIRVLQTTGDLMVEQTLLAEPYNTTLPLALSDENQKTIGYAECQAGQASPLLKKEATRFTQTSVVPLSRLMVAISEKEVVDYEQQLLQGRHTTSFQKALATALQSYFTDGSDPESLLVAISEITEPNTENTTNTRAEQLKNYLNQKGTLLTLLPLEETAPHGERPSANWIFVLSIEGLPDHQFFAVYNPASQKVYSYGFN